MSNLPISEEYRIVAKREAFERRFSPEPNTGCWLWTGMYQSGKEYGLFCFSRKTVKAHRAAWSIYRSDIPHGMNVLHKCDVPACVNPDHLFLGTQGDNIADRHSKGRTKAALGERQHLSKLKACDIPVIRERHASGEKTRALAEEFGVTKYTILRVVHGETWTHV